MKDSETIILKNNLGEEKEYDVLFTVEAGEPSKDYIAYTDNTIDKNGNKLVYVSTYDKTGKDLNYYPVTDDKELQLIDSILSSIQEKLESENN